MNRRTVVSVAVAVFAATAVGEVSTRRLGDGAQTSPGGVETRPLEYSPAGEPAGREAVAFSLLPGLETPDPDWAVDAFRFNVLVGRHHSVRGADLGLLGNLVDNDFSGFAVALGFNDCGRADSAFSLAGVFNHASWNYSGLQFALGMNDVEGVMTGVQVSLYNRASRLTGLQFGAINFTERGKGVQIGIVNSTDLLRGGQIGVINIISQSSFPFWPIVNFSF